MLVVDISIFISKTCKVILKLDKNLANSCEITPIKLIPITKFNSLLAPCGGCPRIVRTPRCLALVREGFAGVKHLEVGIRGDFSLQYFLCVEDKEKYENL